MTPLLALKYSAMALGDLFVLLVLWTVFLKVLAEWIHRCMAIYFEEKLKFVTRLEKETVTRFNSKEKIFH